MKKHNFMSGVLVLSIGGILAKIFSAIYRIGLTRILGGVGIGLYQLVFPLYSLCVVLATAGLPMAISKVIARNRGSERSVLKKCFMFTSIISLTLTFILLTFATPLASLQGKSEISICYIILAPTIILVSSSSVLRGFFQGRENFVPSAVSNIAEQFIKLVVGLILSLVLLKVSLLSSIIGAMVSIVVSELVSIIIMLIYFKKSKLKKSETSNLSFREIAVDVLPITATNIIMPLASFIDSILVVNLLSISFTRPMSIFLYGLESGAVSSLVSLPTIFSFAIASVILPNISLKGSIFSRSHKLSLAVKIILIISVPCLVCFVFVPNRIINLLYAERLNGLGVEGLNIAYRLLTISGMGVVFLALNQVFSSSLQAVDKRSVTVRNLVLAVVVKFVIECIFMPSVKINIYALSIANTACYLTAMTLNLAEIRENFNIRINYLFSGKLILANAGMLFSLLTILSAGSGTINCLLAFIVAVIVYFVLLIVTKIFSKRDLASIKYKVGG